MKKHEQTDVVFAIKHLGEWIKVVPFNGETEKFLFRGKMINDVSWSHGTTHYKFEDGTYAGFCGVQWFEENAQKLGPLVERDWLHL